MTDPRTSRNTVSDNLLALVLEDMPVFDSRNKKVGRVRDVFMGAAGDESRTSGNSPATTIGTEAPFDDREGVGLSEIFKGSDDIPQVLRNRMRHEGFIRIDAAGLFAADRFATRQQVASVSEAGVMLNVAFDELIKS